MFILMQKYNFDIKITNYRIEKNKHFKIIPLFKNKMLYNLRILFQKWYFVRHLKNENISSIEPTVNIKTLLLKKASKEKKRLY